MNTNNTKISIQKLMGMLESFGLKHSGEILPDLLEQADMEEQSNKEFLMCLLDAEVKTRNEKRHTRNYAAAHFPPNIKTLEEFVPEELDSGITREQINRLKELTWPDTCGNLIFAGPPGLGKTMLALGFGKHAVNEGYTVCFETMNRFINILDKADYDRKAGFRLKYIKKVQLLIIDEIGYTPITGKQANSFFSFITETYENTSMIFTTNKEIPEWAETMGDPVLTSALLERILCGARCFSLKGESYRLKNPDLFLS
jgi:DNA replication protein DnaC